MLKAPKLQRPVVLKEHIQQPSGKWKTVCVTACLTALGIPFDSFRVTGSLEKPNYLSIINNNRLLARSRKSYLPKGATIGKARKAIAKLDENLVYFVILKHKGYCHAILLNGDGKTIVDTDPRKADKRKIFSIHAIAKAV